MKWVSDELCPSCRKPLGARLVYCASCKQAVLHRVHEDAAYRAEQAQHRSLRQQHTFTQEFDKRAFELVLEKLKKLDKVTVSNLIDLLYAEGFFDKYKHGYKDVDGTIRFLPAQASELKFVGWARKRVLGLAKWWAKNEVAFIGAQVAQGHPYLFYLGAKPDAIFDPMMPKKSIAQRSVNRVSHTLKTEQVSVN